MPARRTLLLSLFAVVLCATAADAAQRIVLGENFTATWCQYCPITRGAYDYLINNYPGRFIGIQIHGDDSYATTWGNQRMSYYALGGYPLTIQDGIKRRNGAYDQSVYVNDFLARTNTPTDVTLELGGAPISGQTYRISATVGLEATGTAKTVRVYLTQVLDRYPDGSPPYRNTFVQAAPYQDVALTPGQTVTIHADFTFSGASWTYKDNMKIIAWAQMTGVWNTGSEVYQAAVMNWPFLLDCNNNGIADATDIANGTSHDCNANGTPDECEPGGATDCNNNGQSDLCDIYMGLVPDCNNNAVPDACDISSGTSQDCNGNGIPDECDIAACNGDPACSDCNSNGIPDGCETDCNNNGIPDDCDLVNQTSFDCNHNAIPDECDLAACDGAPWCSDCNGNGQIDYCDLIADFNMASPSFTPFGTGYVHTLMMPNAPEAAGDITLHFSAKGDLAYANEYLVIKLNGTQVGQAYGNGIFFACIPEQEATVVISQAMFNSLLTGGNAEISFEPTSAVNPASCSGDNYFTVTVSYSAYSGSTDANGDGVPDECESPSVCLGDMNCDGIVTFKDIDRFVAALGYPGGAGWPHACPWSAADCSGDGAVTFKDIDPFVARMGANCP